MSFRSNASRVGSDHPATSLDPHGRAALLLVESLIHGLISRSALSIADALEVIQVAADIEAEMVIENEDQAEVHRMSLALIEQMSSSLERDLNE